MTGKERKKEAKRLERLERQRQEKEMAIAAPPEPVEEPKVVEEVVEAVKETVEAAADDSKSSEPTRKDQIAAFEAKKLILREERNSLEDEPPTAMRDERLAMISDALRVLRLSQSDLVFTERAEEAISIVDTAFFEEALRLGKAVQIEGKLVQTPMKDDEGKPLTDEGGNPVFKSSYTHVVKVVGLHKSAPATRKGNGKGNGGSKGRCEIEWDDFVSGQYREIEEWGSKWTLIRCENSKLPFVVLKDGQSYGSRVGSGHTACKMVHYKEKGIENPPNARKWWGAGVKEGYDLTTLV